MTVKSKRTSFVLTATALRDVETILNNSSYIESDKTTSRAIHIALARTAKDMKTKQTYRPI